MESKPISLLLVEDDEADILDIQRSMQLLKVPNPLYIARDGIEALAMLQGTGEDGGTVVPYPYLILLDLNLPRMDGLEFLKAVRNDPKLRSTMIIIITSSDDEQTRAAAFDLNVPNYLSKPVNFDHLIAMIATLERSWNPHAQDEMPPSELIGRLA